MKVIDFRQVPPKEEVEGVNLRLVISSEDGASTFVMRVLEVESGHSTPSHDHDWDHEVFVLAGEGAVMSGGGMTPLAPGSVVFVPANEHHQFVNTGAGVFRFICCIPRVEESP
ncbi:MAG: cupin domain-containing protein [Dehalococcoidia bacterium]|jgi:quercetin dioxygenase-like cupin family protein